eukprot:TRINITY_DN3086_c0_g3_i1.p1 TRINITY_DN3086_c0_g3~~TRINITY_DN3086_c0_g3_i1.p1  ORF type:complete len:590 (-),score=143.50 TRINITY_DN3086_c0_g3_i1:10-1779(-)
MEDLSALSEHSSEDNLVDERLLSLLFSKDTPLDLEYEKYLASLTSYSLERLTKEPEMLKQEGIRIKQQMEDLAFKNYKAFIFTSQSVQTIHREISKVNFHLQSMIQCLPKLSTSCKDFCSKAQDITQKRQLNKLTLQNYTQLLEVLEIPQLMETCVRNSSYEEALELEMYTQKLKRLHPENTIIQDISEEVRISTDVMLLQLHQQLRSNIQLPACFRVIGFFKRLGVYNERELRLSFLQSRGAWLQNVLSSIPTSNAYNYLTKLTDYSRTHLFDIITQYRAIFSDDSSAQDEPLEDGGLLYGWMIQVISDFLATLEKYLPDITEGLSIGNILDQCMYYGISLGRVGVDFRGLLVPIFEKAIYNMFSNMITVSTTYFTDTLRNFKPTINSKPLSLGSTIETKEQLSPPYALLDYPTIAIMTNGYLSALNELRHCAVVSLQHRLADRISDSFVSVAQSLQNAKKEIAVSGAPTSKKTEEEEKQLSHMSQVVAENFVPHISHCFHALFQSGRQLVDPSKALSILETLYEKQSAVNVSIDEDDRDRSIDQTDTNFFHEEDIPTEAQQASVDVQQTEVEVQQTPTDLSTSPLLQ